MMFLIVSAGSRPSVRSAGLSGVVPMKIIVGKPWICTRKSTTQKQYSQTWHMTQGAGAPLPKAIGTAQKLVVSWRLVTNRHMYRTREGPSQVTLAAAAAGLTQATPCADPHDMLIQLSAARPGWGQLCAGTAVVP
jgi:hypothetical protein